MIKSDLDNQISNSNLENKVLSVEDLNISLSDKDKSILKYIDQYNNHKSFTHLDLDACAEDLLTRMKSLPKKEIKVFELRNHELDAAGILTQSGEATLYRNDEGQICISPAIPLFHRLLSGW